MKFKIDKQERYTVLSLEEDNLNTMLAPELKSEFVIMRNEGLSIFYYKLSIHLSLKGYVRIFFRKVLSTDNEKLLKQ